MPRPVRKIPSRKATTRLKPRPRRQSPVVLWLDRDVINHFRARGKDWRSRINATLREADGI